MEPTKRFCSKTRSRVRWCSFDFGRIDLLVTVTAADKSVSRFTRFSSATFIAQIFERPLSRNTVRYGLHFANNFI